jgi:hypothetical protein
MVLRLKDELALTELQFADAKLVVARPKRAIEAPAR